MTIHTVRDGATRVLRLNADVVASATSARPGAPRWSEIVLYRLTSGQYIISKIGRSTVAHRPECGRVNWKMPKWLEAGEEGRIRRVPCVECFPDVGDQMDPMTRLEPSRYTVIPAVDMEEVCRVLTEDRLEQDWPRIIQDLISQLRTRRLV